MNGRPDPGYSGLLWAVLRREYLVFVRYPANALGELVVWVLLFGLVFLGGGAIAQRAVTDSLEGIVVGYFLWTLSTGAYTGVSNDIKAEVQWGTLERHFMSPFGFAPIALAKAVAKVTRVFLVSAVVLVAMVVATGTTLRLDLLTIVPVALLAVVSVLGLGFAAAGLTVLYKRVGNWLGLLQFVFVGLIAAPAFDLGWAKFLPLAQGSALLQRAMIRGIRIWEFPPSELAVLVGVAVAYLLAGYLVFRYASLRARRLGVLGDY